MYDRNVINELNQLSKEVFGSTSKWKKMVEKGVPTLMEEDTVKLTVKDGKEEKETVKTPKFYTGKDGNCEIHQYVLHRYSIPEVREFMLTVKDRQEQVRQAIKKIEEQQKAHAEAKATAEKASGSAI